MKDYAMKADATSSNRGKSQWLYRLLIVQIIGITYSMLMHTVNFGVLKEWLQLVISASVLFCLIKMVKSHWTYGVAVTLLALRFVCVLLRMALSSNAIFPLIRDLFDENIIQVMTVISSSIVWTILICEAGGMLSELVAHSILVKPVDLRLSKSWLWLAAFSLLVSSGVFVLNVLIPDMLRLGTLDIDLYQNIVPFLNMPGILIRIVYIFLLLRMGKTLENAQMEESNEEV